MNEFVEANKPAETPAGPVARPAVAAVNLARQIEQSVSREPSDIVRCSHVFGDFYRCNWWNRMGPARRGLNYDWAGLITDQIRKSSFLKATMKAGELIVEEVSPTSQFHRGLVRD